MEAIRPGGARAGLSGWSTSGVDAVERALEDLRDGSPDVGGARMRAAIAALRGLAAQPSVGTSAVEALVAIASFRGERRQEVAALAGEALAQVQTPAADRAVRDFLAARALPAHNGQYAAVTTLFDRAARDEKAALALLKAAALSAPVESVRRRALQSLIQLKTAAGRETVRDLASVAIAPKERFEALRATSKHDDVTPTFYDEVSNAPGQTEAFRQEATALKAALVARLERGGLRDRFG